MIVSLALPFLEHRDLWSINVKLPSQTVPHFSMINDNKRFENKYF